MLRLLLFAGLIFLSLLASAQNKDSTYFRKQQAAGVKKILINNKFWVWTQKIGDGKVNVLLLHGGPAQSHEYFEIFGKYLPSAGITIYYYDQFGSYFSATPTQDQLKDTSTWKVSRYLKEIEQVREGLGIDHFYIYGHSYGALLALAYTYNYPDHIKGLIFSDMDPNPAELNANVGRASKTTDSLLAAEPKYGSVILRKNQGLAFDTIAYGEEFERLFERNFLVRLESLPDALVRTKKHKNFEVAQKIGPSVFSLDYLAMIPAIRVPVLVIAGGHDFIIAPGQVKALAGRFRLGEAAIAPEGGHIAFVDDPEDYFPALIRFISKAQNYALQNGIKWGKTK
jgi:proline iminopeptidase